MCRYFRQGKCTRGDTCPFSHDLGHPDSFICPYFLEGCCKYGSRCQYDHKYPEVSQASEQGTSKWLQSSRLEHTHSEASTLSAYSSPWRPSATGTIKHPEDVLSSHRSHKLSTSAAPFTQGRASAGHMSRAAFRVQDDKRPICVYFQTGACQFGDKCRFRHAMSEDTQATEAAVKTAVHATRIANSLRSICSAPVRKHRPEVLTSLNWSLACSKPITDAVQVAPLRQKSAWDNGLLVHRNPHGFPQTLPESSCQQPQGWKIVDSNVDSMDPWERSLHPSTISLRPPPVDRDADAARDLTSPYEGDAMATEVIADHSELLCSEHAMTGMCPVRDTCLCLHGDICPSCGYHVLHPTDEDMRTAHQTACSAHMMEAERMQVMQAVLFPLLLLCLPSSCCR